MKLKNQLKKFCKKCGTHTAHAIKKVKKGKPSSLAWIVRQKNRRGGVGNKGKFSKPPATRYKTAKAPHLILTCSECNTHKNMSLPRMSKFELIQ